MSGLGFSSNQRRTNMRSRWIVTLFAAGSVLAAYVGLQGCAGVGGPVGSNAGTTDDAARAFTALLDDSQKSSTYVGAAACGDCHNGDRSKHAGGTRSAGDTIYTDWQATAHAGKGVTCEKCHGPGSAHVANPSTTNILPGKVASSPVVCAQCHTQVASDYEHSGHAEVVSTFSFTAANVPTTSTAVSRGQTSRCLACHVGAFRTAYVTPSATDTTVVDSIASLTGQQILDTWSSAVLNDKNPVRTATCTTCHDPHAITGNLNKDGKEVQLRAKAFNSSTTLITNATTAAQFTAYNQTCGQCHNARGADASDTGIAARTNSTPVHDSPVMNLMLGTNVAIGTSVPPETQSAHAQIPGQCSQCHMGSSSRHTFTVSYDTGCVPCHTAADAAARASSTKSSTLSALVALRDRLGVWASTKLGNSLYWEYTNAITSAGLTAPNQSTVPVEIKRARYNYYLIIRSGDYGIHNAKMVNYLIDEANLYLDSQGISRSARTKRTTEQMLAIVKGDLARAKDVANWEDYK